MAVVSVKQLDNGLVEYDLGYAIVRLPVESPTEKQMKEITDAAKRFYKKAVQQGAL